MSLNVVKADMSWSIALALDGILKLGVSPALAQSAQPPASGGFQIFQGKSPHPGSQSLLHGYASDGNLFHRVCQNSRQDREGNSLRKVNE